MQLQDVLYYLAWAGLFFVMMRYGCGSHVMGHGHHRGAFTPHQTPGPPDRKSLQETAIDPVCGMTVQIATAKTAASQGQIVYFCSQKCRDKFEAAPQTFMNAIAADSSLKEHHDGCC